MQDSASIRYREPLKLLSAVLFGTRRRASCSLCRKRIVGLPYPAGLAQLSFCNSHCFVTYNEARRSRARKQNALLT